MDDVLLRMGEYDMATDEEEYPYVERKVQLMALHPQFDLRTFEYDLALLRFSDPVRFQPNIIPICLPEGNGDFVGDIAFVTGWGRLYEGRMVIRSIQVLILINMNEFKTRFSFI